jgi:hypothetical protein
MQANNGKFLITRYASTLRRPGRLAQVALSLMLCFFFMTDPCPLFGQPAIELHTLDAGNIVVRYEPTLFAAAKEVAQTYPVLKKELEKTLGWEIRFKPTVLLIKEEATFRALSGGEMIVAYAKPGSNLIVIDYSRMGTHQFTLGITFKHELCHLLLHSFIPHGLPRWLDEGVSQWVTGGLAEIFVEDRRSLLKEAALSGRLLPLRELTSAFPENRAGLMLAYEESRSFVEYLADTYGSRKLLDVLSALRNGATAEEALARTLGLSTAALEKEWAAHVRERVTWLIYLSDNVYDILFFLAALLTIVAAVKTLLRRLSRRRIAAQEEDEE